MTVSEPHPRAPVRNCSVKLGDREFSLSPEFEKIGKLACAGLGVEPGMVGYFARYSDDHLFDEIEEIDIRDGSSLEIPGAKGISFGFSTWTNVQVERAGADQGADDALGELIGLVGEHAEHEAVGAQRVHQFGDAVARLGLDRAVSAVVNDQMTEARRDRPIGSPPCGSALLTRRRMPPPIVFWDQSRQCDRSRRLASTRLTAEARRSAVSASDPSRLKMTQSNRVRSAYRGWVAGRPTAAVECPADISTLLRRRGHLRRAEELS